MTWYDVTYRCAYWRREDVTEPERGGVGEVKADSPEEAARAFDDTAEVCDAIIDVFESSEPDEDGRTTGAHLGAFRVTSRRVVDVAPYTPGESA